MRYKGAFSFLILLSAIINADDAKLKEENTLSPEEDQQKPKNDIKEFFDPRTEMPPFHLMNDFKNGYTALPSFVIPVFRNGIMVCRIEIEVVLQSENFKTSLELYRKRRLLQDKLYAHFYWLFDLGWEENWHPDLEPIRKNIIKALQPLDQKKLIKNVLINSFVSKNT